VRLTPNGTPCACRSISRCSSTAPLAGGTGLYFAGDTVPLQVAPVAWSKETCSRLPVRVWKEMMDAHYPDTVWLCLRRDVVDRLNDYKSRNGIPTWDQAMESALDAADEVVSK
jgi:hypothetical protein